MNTDKEIQKSLANKSIKYDLFEFICWVVFALFISSEILQLIFEGKPIYEVVVAHFDRLNISVLMILIPYMFKSLFGHAPIGALLRKVNDLTKEDTTPEKVEFSSDVDPLDIWNAKKVANSNPMEYFANLAVSSRKLAKSLRTRSNLYLFIGVTIAFSGLAFFYIQANQNSPATTTAITQSSESTTDQIKPTESPRDEDTTNKELIRMAQSFGILFFIEFVAFFFLKQYRAVMDEFRYYESLQRYREETLALLKLAASEAKTETNDNTKEQGIYKFVKECGFRTTIDKLENGQTTELLESKKLSKDEAEIFNKILDILGKNK